MLMFVVHCNVSYIATYGLIYTNICIIHYRCLSYMTLKLNTGTLPTFLVY